jgi:hypothetical protein
MLSGDYTDFERRMIVNDVLGLMRDYGYNQTTMDYEADFIQKVIT